MNNLGISLFGIGAMLFGIIVAILASAFGLGRRVGPWLVRGKHWLIGVLSGQVQVDFIQVAIVLLGCAGALLISYGGTLNTWGITATLAAQPFWILATMRTKQWGMLAMALFYTVVWGVGALIAWGLV